MWGWLQHHASRIMFWAVILYLPAWTLNQVLASTVLPFVFLAVFIVAQVAAGRHHFVICDRCALDYPAEQGPDLAEKHAFVLGYQHNIRWQVAWCLATFVTLFAVLFTDGVVWFAMTAVFVTVSAFEWRARRVHDRLRPWCPGCRRDGGDHDVPVPDPSLTQERT